MIQKLEICNSYTDRGRVLLEMLAFALAPCTFVLKVCNSYTDRGRVLLEMWLSLERRAHSSEKCATVSRIEADSFSKWGSRLSAAHIRLNKLQQL